MVKPNNSLSQRQLEQEVPELIRNLKELFAQMPEFVQALTNLWLEQGIQPDTWITFRKGPDVFAIQSHLYSKDRYENLLVKHMLSDAKTLDWKELLTYGSKEWNKWDQHIELSISSGSTYFNEYRVDCFTRNGRKESIPRLQ